MLRIYLTTFALTSLAASVALPRQSSPWDLNTINSLITFGDSYTDENRLSYFIAHNGSAPPPGTYLPEGLNTASGGRTWPRFVVQYTGNTDSSGQWTPGIELYDYAVSGAVCSNNITPRYVSTMKCADPLLTSVDILPQFMSRSLRCWNMRYRHS